MSATGNTQRSQYSLDFLTLLNNNPPKLAGQADHNLIIMIQQIVKNILLVNNEVRNK